MPPANTLVCVRSWKSPDDHEDAFLELDSNVYEALRAFVEHDVLPANVGLRNLVLASDKELNTRETRSCIAARIALTQGARTNILTWDVVDY